MTEERTQAAETFDGYVRDNRRAGIRNHVLVLPSVICSSIVAESIASAVPEAVCASHDHGCGQIGADKQQTRQTLLNVAENPNIAGVVVVGLGCETLDSRSIAADISVPVRHTAIQTAGGTQAAIDEGSQAARDLVRQAGGEDRSTVNLDELTLGVATSDFSASTVREIHPLVGSLCGHVVDAGGRVVVDATDALAASELRAGDLTVDEGKEARLTELLETAQAGPQSVTTDDSVPAADLTKLFADEPIREVVPYGDQTTLDTGVAVVETSSAFEETATGMVAAGAQLIVHGTAAGIPTGHPLAPVMKVTADPGTLVALTEDIDVDATEQRPDALAERVRAVANGESTAAEEHGLAPFAITRSGPSL
jgi:altronate dehydratase large subunit